MLLNKLGVDVLLLMLCRLRFCTSFQSDNIHLLDSAEPDIRSVVQIEADVGRMV